MQNVASLARTAYGIDFDREYEKILPRLLTNHTLRVEARGQDLAMGDMALILQNKASHQEHQFTVIWRAL